MTALPRIVVEKPTLGMIFSVNTSPLSGQEGEAIQSRKLRDRLVREVRQNVALRFEEMPTNDQFRVLGRGELQFAILIEQMRRENFEFMVGKPTVLYRTGRKRRSALEPMERAVLDLPETAVGDVTGMFQARKGHPHQVRRRAGDGTGRVRLEFDIPDSRTSRNALALSHRHARRGSLQHEASRATARTRAISRIARAARSFRIARAIRSSTACSGSRSAASFSADRACRFTKA